MPEPWAQLQGQPSASHLTAGRGARCCRGPPATLVASVVTSESPSGSLRVETLPSGSFGASSPPRSEPGMSPPVATAGQRARPRAACDVLILLPHALLLAPQLLIVDGQQLRASPAAVMDEIQKFLGVTPHYNYSQALT